MAASVIVAKVGCKSGAGKEEAGSCYGEQVKEWVNDNLLSMSSISEFAVWTHSKLRDGRGAVGVGLIPTSLQDLENLVQVVLSVFLAETPTKRPEQGFLKGLKELTVAFVPLSVNQSPLSGQGSNAVS